MKIGQYNKLKVARVVDFGIYLSDADGNEVLLPARYLTELPAIGDEMDLFVYTDSEDRPVATTERPYAEVGQVAFLQVVEVNRVGAFLDWGLMKDLLVPYREQKYEMKQGGLYPVYLFLDHASGRVTATAKIEKYLGNTIPAYRRNDKVKALVLQRQEAGYRVVVDNRFFGMLYHNELFREVAIGEELEAYVKHVRDDNKIDLTLSNRAANRIADLSERILAYMRNHGDEMPVNDHTDPEIIKSLFQCSKKDFKKAIGALYKNHRVEITPVSIRLL